MRLINMPLTVTGETYFRTAEACRAACISKNTFLRWVRDGICTDVKNRDRRRWRLFTEEDVDRLKVEANRINQTK
jgi:predicted site-specific integrase-resolvase